jgi:hypothetical protein
MRFALLIACVLTFCVVCVGYSDAIVPLGYVLVELIRGQDEPVPMVIRVLLLVPFALILLPTLIARPIARSLLTLVGVFFLTLLWLVGIVLFVIYPMPDNQIPDWVPGITSIPFVVTVISTTVFHIRSARVAYRISV